MENSQEDGKMTSEVERVRNEAEKIAQLRVALNTRASKLSNLSLLGGFILGALFILMLIFFIKRS